MPGFEEYLASFNAWHCWILIGLIVVNLLLAASFILQGDIFYHTDIARDFLLVDEIVRNRDITLIGPRAGMAGVFHGPLWLYLYVIPFVIGNGSSVVMGWFWWVLSVVSVGIVYRVGGKLHDTHFGLLASCLMSFRAVFYANNLLNPFGAVLLTLVFAYFFIRYLQKKNGLLDLTVSFFVLGLMIQFEMAYAVPILVLAVAWVAYRAVLRRSFKPFLAILAVTPGLRINRGWTASGGGSIGSGFAKRRQKRCGLS